MVSGGVGEVVCVRVSHQPQRKEHSVAFSLLNENLMHY